MLKRKRNDSVTHTIPVFLFYDGFVNFKLSFTTDVCLFFLTTQRENSINMNFIQEIPTKNKNKNSVVISHGPGFKFFKSNSQLSTSNLMF